MLYNKNGTLVIECKHMFGVDDMVCAYLEKLHKDYLEEKNAIDKAIAELEIRLKENVEFIKMLDESVEASYEFFSPRETYSKTKIQVSELKEKQEEILFEIERAEEQQSEIIEKIEELENVIEFEKENIKKANSNNTKGQNNVSGLSILEIQENERQRISRELHDSTVQNLTSIVHKTELCNKLLEIDPIRCKLELVMMSRTIRDIINDTRKMIYNLRPMSFDDIGLDITIERAIDKMKNDQSCNIGFLVEGESYTIHPVVGITLLRIIQEACNNAIKYAEADVIRVKMIYAENEVIITIEDDGKGFDAAYLDVDTRKDNSGFGLSMMKERVYLLSGDIEIISKPGEGTKIKVVVPIYNKEEK